MLGSLSQRLLHFFASLNNSNYPIAQPLHLCLHSYSTHRREAPTDGSNRSDVVEV